METLRYKEFAEEHQHFFKANNLKALSIVLTLSALSMGLIYSSQTDHFLIWIISQLGLSVVILQWFVLVHDLGHGNYFSHKILNVFWGHVASVPVILPYYPWRYIHNSHHKWTGWKDKDPTMGQTIPREKPSAISFFMNFCWKFWIPIFSVSFSLGNFWNLSKIFKLYKNTATRRRCVFSILFLLLFYSTLIYLCGWQNFFQSFALAYLMFLVISDPLLISQHSSVPQRLAKGQEVKPVHYKDQGEFTRSLVFPLFIQKYILMGFNQHVLHHYFPTIPGYYLCKMEFSGGHKEHWRSWLKWAKQTPAYDLMLSAKLNVIFK